MLFQNILLPGVIVPIGVAILGGLVALFLGRMLRFDLRRPVGASLAVAGGFVAGYASLTGVPQWPPVSSTEKLPVVVALVGLFAAAAVPWSQRRRATSFAPEEEAPRALPRVLFAVLCAATTAYLLQNLISNSWTALRSGLWIGAAAVVGWLAFGTLHAAFAPPFETGPGEHRSLGATAVGIVARLVWGSLLAGCLALGSSAILAQYVGAAVAAIGVVEVAGVVLERRFWHPLDVLPLGLIVLALPLAGHHFADLTLWPALLVLVSILALGPRRSGAVRQLPAIAFLIAALGLLAWAKAQEPADPYGDYYDEYGAIVLPDEASALTGSGGLRLPGVTRV